MPWVQWSAVCDCGISRSLKPDYQSDSTRTSCRKFGYFITFILLDFSLTVKAATLIFIFGLGSAISSTKQGNSGFIYNLVKSLSALWSAQTCVHFMKS